jgi:hypothetical protein
VSGHVDGRRISGRLARGAVAITLLLGGCGVAANTSPATLPSPNAGPTPGVGAATGATFGAIRSALSSVAQIGEATRPYRPAESARLRATPRTVYQIVLRDQPDAGFIVVYEYPDAAAAVDAGNEEAGYLGTGAAKVQFPPGTQHVLRALGPTLILFSWLPAASPDPTTQRVAAALGTLGVGFTVPN